MQKKKLLNSEIRRTAAFSRYINWIVIIATICAFLLFLLYVSGQMPKAYSNVSYSWVYWLCGAALPIYLLIYLFYMRASKSSNKNINASEFDSTPTEVPQESMDEAAPQEHLIEESMDEAAPASDSLEGDTRPTESTLADDNEQEEVYTASSVDTPILALEVETETQEAAKNRIAAILAKLDSTEAIVEENK